MVATTAAARVVGSRGSTWMHPRATPRHGCERGSPCRCLSCGPGRRRRRRSVQARPKQIRPQILREIRMRVLLRTQASGDPSRVARRQLLRATGGAAAPALLPAPGGTAVAVAVKVKVARKRNVLPALRLRSRNLARVGAEAARAATAGAAQRAVVQTVQARAAPAAVAAAAGLQAVRPVMLPVCQLAGRARSGARRSQSGRRSGRLVAPPRGAAVHKRRRVGAGSGARRRQSAGGVLRAVRAAAAQAAPSLLPAGAAAAAAAVGRAPPLHALRVRHRMVVGRNVPASTA